MTDDKEKYDDTLTKWDYILGFGFVGLLFIGLIVSGIAIMQMS